MRILVIDDCPCDKIDKKKAKKITGWKIHVPKNFNLAKQCLRKGKYDLILLDERLCGWAGNFNGGDIFTRLRNGDYGINNQNTAIISISNSLVRYAKHWYDTRVTNLGDVLFGNEKVEDFFFNEEKKEKRND